MATTIRVSEAPETHVLFVATTIRVSEAHVLFVATTIRVSEDMYCLWPLLFVCPKYTY